MGLKRWLCDRYGNDVTVGDMLPDIFKTCFSITMVSLFLNGARNVMWGYLTIDDGVSTKFIVVQAISHLIFIAGCIGIVFVLLVIIIYYICKIKVVSCKRSDKR